MYYIYSIHNGLFHKTYIGFTRNYNRRIVVHKSELKNGKHPCTEMQSDYNHSLYSNNNYMTYKLLAQHDNKEIAQGLEYLFYTNILHTEKRYITEIKYCFRAGLLKKRMTMQIVLWIIGLFFMRFLMENLLMENL